MGGIPPKKSSRATLSLVFIGPMLPMFNEIRTFKNSKLNYEIYGRPESVWICLRESGANQVFIKQQLYLVSILAIQRNTVLSGHPLLSRQYPKSPNLFPLCTLNETFNFFKRHFFLWPFLLLPTCIKRTLVIKFHHPTCQTPEMRKIATHKF